MTMAVTILDVAKKAGVSQSTVSLVINDSAKVSYKTRSRILKVIKDLGYIPNRGARSIVTSRTSNIGLLVVLENNLSDDPYSMENIVNSFSTDIVAGVEQEIYTTNYGLIYARCDGRSEQELPKIVDPSYIDGLIIIGGSYTTGFLKAIEKTEIPTIITGSNYTTRKISSIFCDTYTAMKEMILYLIKIDRRSIALINSSNVSFNSEAKLKGYRDALIESGLPFDEKLVIATGFSGIDGAKAVRALLKAGKRIDAIACAFDGLAVGALRELYAQKIQVPQQIALTGFEDSWIASHAIPSITTVRIPKFKIGKMLLNNLLDILKGRTNPGFKILVDADIIVRETTP
ncbi:LacI family transcriptional regulator [Spirochaetia bacterium]|nr:LacI family transcriptional regulator [Spirochaetia bacterium]